MRHLIVGLGSIGRRHAELLLQHSHEVVGVDVSPGYSMKFPVYACMEDGWKSNPDMVWICTPTHLHSRQAVEVLERGVHVFIEKPVAHDFESAIAVRDAWDKMKEKRLVWVACNMRFHPGVIRLKNAINEGLIGTPLIRRLHFSHYLPNMRPDKAYHAVYAAQADQGGGIILDDIHDIDLALWFGGPVEKVNGIAANSGTMSINVEDIAHMFLVHKNRTFSEIHMDFLRRDKSRGIVVIGDKGTLEWQSSGKNPEQACLKWFSAGEKDAKILWEEQISNFNDMFILQLNSIMNSIERQDGYVVRLTESIDALKIALEVRL